MPVAGARPLIRVVMVDGDSDTSDADGMVRC